MKGHKVNPISLLNLEKRKMFQAGYKPSKESIAKMKATKKLQPVSPKSLKNLTDRFRFKKGHTVSGKIRKKMSERQKGRFGELANHWKGGLTPEQTKIRNSDEYLKWRIAVFERDGYTCVVCRKVGVYLEAHHIKEFSKYPELRLDINNGITLCKDCHKLTR